MSAGENHISIDPDYLDLLKLLNAHEVRYLVVGAFAYGLYCRPRTTRDLDIFVANDSVNAAKVIAVLSEFGFENPGLTVEDMMSSDTILQLGYPPVRIDIITSISGIDDFDSAWQNRTRGTLGSETVNVISKSDLIANKIASGRLRDLSDVEDLKKEPVSREEAFKKHPPRTKS